MGPGPLFQYSDGRALTRARFAIVVRLALKKAGVDQEKHCTHSFRIGAATTAAARGIKDSVIKTQGMWESLAYVRIQRERLTGYSKRLIEFRIGTMYRLLCFTLLWLLLWEVSYPKHVEHD